MQFILCCMPLNFRYMKVVCINDKGMKSADGSIGSGKGLIKGNIYEYTHIEKSIWGDDCYFIKGLGLRQCKRFKAVDNSWVDELLEKITKEVCEFA